jgi:hypothetical protein
LEKEPLPQKLTANNATNRTYTASIAAYPIEVWGERIRNDEEPYPFLEFRNVTYMPLTWKLAHRRLMMDLRWSDEDGLAVWSGQDQVLGQIVYDDDESLYVSAGGAKDKTHTMLKIAKSLKDAPVWLDPEQAKEIRDKADQALQALPVAGNKVTIELKGDMLTYQGLPLAPLRDEDKIELGGSKLQIEGTLYDIDDKRKLVSVYTYFPIAVIGPPPGSRYQLFAIVNGQVNAIPEYPYLPQRVLKNADGTVWIARERMFSRQHYFSGSGLLALMDRDGHVRVANDVWNEQDVSPIGLNSPTRNPAEQDGRIIVRLYGNPKVTKDEYRETAETDWEKDGLYEADTGFGLRRLSNAPDPQDDLLFYKDSRGDLYTISLYSNTITNWTQNRYRTWTDGELLENS